MGEVGVGLGRQQPDRTVGGDVHRLDAATLQMARPRLAVEADDAVGAVAAHGLVATPEVGVTPLHPEQ